MNRFSLELARLILDLEMQADKLVNESVVNKMLCCCRSRLLNNYISTCQLMAIKFVGKIIKFKEDFDVQKTTVKDLRHWFYLENYSKMYIKNAVSNKMILLLHLLQSKSDNRFFDRFEVMFDEIVHSFQGEEEDYFKNSISKIFDELQDWMDDHILGLLSLKINCMAIDNKILEDYKELLGFNSETDEHNLYQNLEGMCGSKHLYDTGEILHLYLTEENILDAMPCEYTTLITKYHENPNKIELILDFQLLEKPIICDGTHLSVLERNLNKFGSVKIVNHELITFTKDFKHKYLLA
jgi:hypothetical protein